MSLIPDPFSLVLVNNVDHDVDQDQSDEISNGASFNVPRRDFKLTGTPKVYAKTGNSGSEIRRYFCGHCGSYILHRDRLDRQLIFRPVYVETDSDLVDGKATDDTPVYVKIGLSSPVTDYVAVLNVTRTVPCW